MGEGIREDEGMARVEISEHTLQDLAGDLFFARGNIYFHNGSVRELEMTGGGAAAAVDGTRPQPYQVSLEIVRGRLEGECDCPVGQDGLFCKHCVAVGLAWLEETGGVTDGFGIEDGGGADSGTELRSFLLSQEPEWLVDELLRAAADNPALRTRLHRAIRADDVAALDVQAIRRNLEDVIAIDEYVDWHAAHAYTGDIDEALGSLDDLLDNGRADEVIGLAEHVLELLEQAASGIDDSSGGMGSALARVEEIHLRACEEGNPDPVALGRRLAEHALGNGWLVFDDVVPAYAEILGEAGLAAYRAVIDRAWSELPALTPGDHRSYEHGRYTVTTLKEKLARLDGDTDALVEVLAHDLSADHKFLGIARVLVDAGRDADALGWLERGAAAFPNNPTRLNHVAAEIHRRDGRGERAVELVWAEFTRSPSLAAYQLLADYAGAAGSGQQDGEAPPTAEGTQAAATAEGTQAAATAEGTQAAATADGTQVAVAEDTQVATATGGAWPQWRERALGLLRGQPGARAPRNPRPAWERAQGHSTTLVEVLLWEGDVDGAWQAAVRGGCNEPLWLRLARRRAVDHPLDAVPILRRHAEAAIGMKQRDFYRTAASLLREARDLHERAGDTNAFTAYLRQLRGAHRPKRALMEELDRAGLRI